MPLRSRIQLSILLLLLLTAAITSPPANAAVKKPSCEALEAWAATVDTRDRWQPLKGSRTWLPRAFEKKEFETLFGARALQWTNDDVRTIAGLLNVCRGKAAKARRREQQNALGSVRSIVRGNLRAIATQVAREQAKSQAQSGSAAGSSHAQSQPAATQSPADARRAAREKAAEQKRAKLLQARTARDRANAEKRVEKDRAKVSAALDTLLAQPDSADVLRALAVARTADISDPVAYNKAIGQIGVYQPGRELLRSLYNSRVTLKDPALAKRIDARYATLNDSVVAAKLAEIEGMNSSLNGINRLSQMWRDLPTEMGPALTKADRKKIGAAIGAKRAVIQDEIVVRAKQLIDNAPANAEGLHRIDNIVRNARKAVIDKRQVQEMLQYAEARRHVVSETALMAATEKLDMFPKTLAGLKDIRQFAAESDHVFAPHATKEVGKRFDAAVVARTSDVARGALPEYRKQLAALPDTFEGLQKAKARTIAARAMQNVEPGVRDAYAAVAAKRQASIDAAIDRNIAKRRKKALAAGGDPDIAGYTFVDTTTGSMLDFRDEEMVMIAFVGIKAAGTYKVSENDVIVKGPHGVLVFTKHGKSLTGNGLTFDRQR